MESSSKGSLQPVNMGLNLAPIEASRRNWRRTGNRKVTIATTSESMKHLPYIKHQNTELGKVWRNEIMADL